MEQHVLINGTEISDYWGYLKSVRHIFFSLLN